MNDNKIPSHVTIIMDGNGRWAKARGKERIQGHFEGVESVRDCCEYAVEVGIKYLSLYAFSTENWGRPADEVSGLMALMARSVLKERPVFMKNNIRFRVVGDRSLLPADLCEDIAAAEEETSGNSGLTLIVMLNYSGKWDILQAVQRYGEILLRNRSEGVENVRIDYDTFASLLSTAGIPDPDLMIRTSGEQRISNYMLWQCAYTEFYFTDVLWPDFRREQFRAALEDYAGRRRRYGKTDSGAGE